MKAFSKKLELYRNLCIVWLLNIILGTPAIAQQSDRDAMHPFVYNSRTKHELLMDMLDGAEATDSNGVTCRFGVESAAVAGQSDAQDYRLTWTMTKGQIDSTSVGVTFEFKDWSPENFVFVPAG